MPWGFVFIEARASMLEARVFVVTIKVVFAPCCLFDDHGKPKTLTT